MSIVDYFRANPVDNSMTMGQAAAETYAVMPMVPPMTANLLGLNLGIAQWAANNPGPLNQPGFLNSYNNLFGGSPELLSPEPLSALDYFG